MTILGKTVASEDFHVNCRMLYPPTLKNTSAPSASRAVVVFVRSKSIASLKADTSLSPQGDNGQPRFASCTKSFTLSSCAILCNRRS